MLSNIIGFVLAVILAAFAGVWLTNIVKKLLTKVPIGTLVKTVLSIAISAICGVGISLCFAFNTFQIIGVAIFTVLVATFLYDDVFQPLDNLFKLLKLKVNELLEKEQNKNKEKLNE